MGIFDISSDEVKDKVEANDDNKTPVEKIGVNEKETTVLPEVDGKDAKEQKKDINIVLDGPLSQIYTQALNSVYANENMTENIAHIFNSENMSEVDETDLYVYCCNSDDLEDGGLVNATNRISANLNSNRKTIVAIECNRVVTNKVGLLEDFSASVGAKVYLSRKSSLDGVKTALEGI
jgi:hypothetical protein